MPKTPEDLNSFIIDSLKQEKAEAKTKQLS